MTWRVIFNALAAGNQPAASTLDAMFNDTAGMLPIPCNASGTNAIALVPMTNAPTLTAYGFMNLFSFVAPATTTNTVTASFNGLAFLNVYTTTGPQAGAGTFVAGIPYMLMYVPSLNSGAGGFFQLQFGGAGAQVPTGAMLPFAGASPPSGWLTCNGSAVGRNAYASLFATIGTNWGAGDGSTTFNLPDFRGYAWRGLDQGAGVDPSRVLGSAQADALQDHAHMWGNNASFFGMQTGASNGYLPAAGTSDGNLNTTGIRQGLITSNVATETRMKNKASPMIIKY